MSVNTTPEQNAETDFEDRRLNVAERRIRQSENFMYVGLGLALAFFVTTSASSQSQAWLVIGGITVVVFVTSLAMLWNSRR